MTTPTKNATSDQMRILNGIFDKLIRRLHTHQTHPDAQTETAAIHARATYQQELRKVFG